MVILEKDNKIEKLDCSLYFDGKYPSEKNKKIITHPV